MSRERVESELKILAEGGCEALIAEARWQAGNVGLVVIYRDLPTGGEKLGLPVKADVIVPVPAGYPAAAIDLAGLPADSPLLPRLRGGRNSQGILHVENMVWRLASYHPHGTHAGPWNPSAHGFHTYWGEILSWLTVID